MKDKVCIITGATGGIGKRTAEIFAAEGARLVVGGRLWSANQEGLRGMKRAFGIDA